MIEKSSCVFVLLSKTVEIGRYSHCIIDCVIFLPSDLEIDIN